jgi:hypothetical protein
MSLRILNQGTIENIWGRIGRGVWNEMAWFVKLANSTSFLSMSDGERLIWQEEFALMMFSGRPMMQVSSDRVRYPRSETDGFATSLLTPVQMQKAKDCIGKLIEDIADGQGTSVPATGSFDISYSVKFMGNPRYLKHSEREPRYLIFRNEVSTERLQLRLLRLLESFPDTIGIHNFADRLRRCLNPTCKQFFLQIKRNARYCGNRCRSREGMRRLRTERTREKGNASKRRRKRQLRSASKPRRKGRQS